MVIQQYQDPSVNRWLAFGFWYQERKAMLVKVLVRALIAVNALFWLYTLYGVALLVLDMRASGRRTAELIAPLSDVAALHQANAPEPLAILGITVLPSALESNIAAASRADFLARVQNPNPDWIMDVEYAFRWEGGETETNRWLVLPGNETFLAVIGAAVSGLPGAAEAELVTSIAWERVKDPSILVRPADALSGILVETSEVNSYNNITDLSAVVANQSQYTIIGPTFVLVAARFGGEPLAVWVQKSDALPSGGSITSQRRFLRPIPGSLDVSVYPNIDAWSQGTYELRGSDFIPF